MLLNIGHIDLLRKQDRVSGKRWQTKNMFIPTPFLKHTTHINECNIMTKRANIIIAVAKLVNSFSSRTDSVEFGPHWKRTRSSEAELSSAARGVRQCDNTRVLTHVPEAAPRALRCTLQRLRT